MTYIFIQERCSDMPTRVACRAMKVCPSAFYAWRQNPISNKVFADAVLTNEMFDINRMARRAYGSDRVRAELKLGRNIGVSKTRVERLMRQARIKGLYKPAFRAGCTKRDGTKPSDDLVKRAFNADGPDKLWVMDMTEHPTRNGKVYVATVLDVWSRRIVGWSIGDHMRADLVVDAVTMATWRRRPPEGQTVAHSDHGAQYTSWAFSQRLRAAGLLGSMGTIGDCFDNAMAEALFSTMQRELFNTRVWDTKDQLASAIFDWIEGWYNPLRRHTSIGSVSPAHYEQTQLANPTQNAA
jgi:putative transposase